VKWQTHHISLKKNGEISYRFNKLWKFNSYCALKLADAAGIEEKMVPKPIN